MIKTRCCDFVKVILRDPGLPMICQPRGCLVFTESLGVCVLIDDRVGICPVRED